MQRERAQGEGRHDGQEGRPARVQERRHREQGEAADGPGGGPGPQPTAGGPRGEGGGQGGGHGDDQEVHAEAVAEQERAEDGGRQDRPEDGERDQGRCGRTQLGRRAGALDRGLPGPAGLPGLLRPWARCRWAWRYAGVAGGSAPWAA
ncbi:hypothetical protein Smic_62900 [Streptomyces microflavus]|uniref:Uncharacterized protein n=1 Tax=Streptomyces microflavus TaxID=1919 RepID=A0A7J0D0P2_STRMI|nr:hypothetical protein Smic_62900 [Streptomyces microflavus]